MTNRIVTRGLGGGQGVGMVIHGFTFEDVVRGGRSLAKDIYDNLLEEFTIAAKLLEINGKELLAPIFNRRKYTIDESIQHKVSIKNVKVEKRKTEYDTSVHAKLIRVNRGSDGEN
jgi:hypothetical protein